jgi:hypothetical protein
MKAALREYGGERNYASVGVGGSGASNVFRRDHEPGALQLCVDRNLT